MRGPLWILLGAAVLLGSLVATTRWAMEPLPTQLNRPPGEVVRAEIVDRNRQRLTSTYENEWNLHDLVELHDIPSFLLSALLEAEDHRFYDHSGIDWLARAAALVQNLRAARKVRGASTISEQVVRMLHPRRRTLWSRWVEGFEAQHLETQFEKGEILEFYVNQVPFGRQRRGLRQAARDLFDRDLDTLSVNEMIALAVLPRSPSRLDPRNAHPALGPTMERLADRLVAAGHLDTSEAKKVAAAGLRLQSGELDLLAAHFVRWVRSRPGDPARSTIETTLDGSLQASVQAALDQRIEMLARSDVAHGAALVVDHRSNEVLAWVVGGEATEIDAVRARRQPGSTLKPFVYAQALEGGMTAATLLDDSPLVANVGSGVHRFRNYSRRHRGPIRLREALGNSLNVPAVRVAEGLEIAELLEQLREFGLTSLDRHPEFYGPGLALGGGEVSLLELVSAYAVLARGGLSESLHARLDEPVAPAARRLLSAEVATLVGDILSDPEARALEFDRGGILAFPNPTAVKTGTSNDYRDAWALGFSDRYTAGVWMGNLGRGEMQGITGSSGPAFVLRSIFADLALRGPVRPLPLSRKLRQVSVCAQSGALANPSCPSVDEWFRPRHAPTKPCPVHGVRPQTTRAVPISDRPPAVYPANDTATDTDFAPGNVALAAPLPGLHLALDPRIPDALERYAMTIDSPSRPERVEWFIDDQLAARIEGGDRRFFWSPVRGRHQVFARAFFASKPEGIETQTIGFEVR